MVQAQSDLDKAKLNLSYCTVFAEIDGVITRRNVNPGDNLEASQSVMAIRSLRDIWIDANFKETQLRNLRIGFVETLKQLGSGEGGFNEDNEYFGYRAPI